MWDLETTKRLNRIGSAKTLRDHFLLLADEYRLQADRCDEHAAELTEFLDGKTDQLPDKALYAARRVRLFVPEGRIVISAPKLVGGGA